MTRFLGKEGFRVVTASDGDEGLSRARQLRPDLITLDVMMPGLDGWALLAALKADPELADIPVIMLTMADDRNKGFALGASEYLTKPLDRGRLAAILRKYRGRGLCCSALVAEDDEVTRRVLRETLEKEGWDVAEAEDGRAALAAVAARRPDLILLDLLMPEMDGFEFLEELRRHEAWRAIPVIVVTARDLSHQDRERLNGPSRRSSRRARTIVTSSSPRCASWWPPASPAGDREPDEQDPAGRGQRDQPRHALAPAHRHRLNCAKCIDLWRSVTSWLSCQFRSPEYRRGRAFRLEMRQVVSPQLPRYRSPVEPLKASQSPGRREP